MPARKIVTLPSAPASGPRFPVLPHEDYAEIMAIVAAYGRLYDDDRVDDFIDLLAEDAVFHPNRPGVVPEEICGRETLREFFRQSRAGYHTRGVQPRHYATNVIIASATAAAAEVTVSMAYAESRPGGGVELKLVGQYDYHLVKRSGRWSIARWSMRYDW